MSLVILFLLIIYGKQNKELSNWHRILYLTGGMLCKSDKPSIIIIIMLCKSDKPSIIIISYLANQAGRETDWQAKLSGPHEFNIYVFGIGLPCAIRI